jgi:uncharacterized protein
MTQLHRIPFTVMANGMEAFLHIHEIRGGRGDGPTLGICAAIHGDEQVGPAIILDFVRKLDPTKLKGRLLLLPVANPLSFEANTRHNPVDDLNLNRVFPGAAGGWLSEQLALAISREFLDKLDVFIDIHSGGAKPTVDYIYIRNAEDLSRSFGSKLLYRAKSGVAGTMYEGTSSSVTDKRNVPSVTVELGGGVLDQTDYVRRGLVGLDNMLKTAGLLEGASTPPPPQIVMSGITILRPTRGGFIENAAPKLGERVAEGAVLGRIVSPYTFEVLEEIRNPVPNGLMVLAHLTRNLVQPGDYLYMVGRE